MPAHAGSDAVPNAERDSRRDIQAESGFEDVEDAEHEAHQEQQDKQEKQHIAERRQWMGQALGAVAAARPFVDASEHDEIIGPCQNRQGEEDVDRMTAPTAYAIGADDGAQLGIRETLSDMGRHADGKFAHEVMVRLGWRRVAGRRVRGVLVETGFAQSRASACGFGGTEKPDSLASLVLSAMRGNADADQRRCSYQYLSFAENSCL